MREPELVAGLRAGDECAFHALVSEHGGPMLAVARRLLRDECDAQDAVQEALLSVHRRIDSFQGDASFGTWLHRVVVNASLMRLRSRRRVREEALGELGPQFDDAGGRDGSGEAWVPASDEDLECEELRQLVRKQIDDLPEKHRTVLLLRDIEGLDTAETAELLGIAPGAVKTRLHRARQALRELLARELPA